MEYNGAAVVAMTGKDCVAIASDLRYGVQQLTLASNKPKVKSKMSFKFVLILTNQKKKRSFESMRESSLVFLDLPQTSKPSLRNSSFV